MAKKQQKKSLTLNIGKVNVGQGRGPGGPGGAIYGLGFIGALVYFITTATSLWEGVLGVIKAIFWPGFLVHGLLKLIGA